MISFRKQSYFEKYLDVINEKSKTLKKYGYYIKVPQKYDLRFWLLAALKKKLFDVETPKTYYNLNRNEASVAEVQMMRFAKNKGGILIFPADLDITARYAENFHDIFNSRMFKSVFQKYPSSILWHFGHRYRGVYRNRPRGKVFNAASCTLEILGLNSIDLINISVKLAVQFQQPIVLIKDLNNETMIILGQCIEEPEKAPVAVNDFENAEFTDFDIKKLEFELDEKYKLCPAWQHTLWEMHDVYPKFNDFWVENETWYGR